MRQKLHEQDAQEIANKQILKLANEVQLLESKLVLSDTLRNDAVNQMKLMKNQRDKAIEHNEQYQLMSDTQESRADFNGMIAGWSTFVNVALTVSVVILLLP